METQESLRRKLSGAEDLKSVVKTMKAVAASNIGQYETAVRSLGDYYRTVSLGIVAYFGQEKSEALRDEKKLKGKQANVICVLVFGSDQGLVGQFNDSLVEFVKQSFQTLGGKKEIWAVGERIQLLLSDKGYITSKLYPVPNSVNAITPLVQQILVNSEEIFDQGKISEVYIYYNKLTTGSGYEAVCKRLLPLDEKWRISLNELKWPTSLIPQIIGESKPILLSLIHEYLFASIFRACAESLASENASRLTAMQRAEKNIDELLGELSHKFHSLRQSAIDEELFDVVSGFEALKK